jgi:transcriptional regulator with XRE-family HTH domain
MATFSTRLASARKAAGLDQTELAKALGVSQQTVSEWERGESTPRPKRMKAIAAVLGTTTFSLMSEDMGRTPFAQQPGKVVHKIDPRVMEIALEVAEGGMGDQYTTAPMEVRAKVLSLLYSYLIERIGRESRAELVNDATHAMRVFYSG